VPTAFVITPFSGPYLRRYEETFKPALVAAGVEPSTVAEKKGNDVITEKIEEMIRDADIVFAELSQDNANVWYELGFAHALGKPLVMVCHSQERSGKLPFDIAHRHVIYYDTATSGDFDRVKKEVEEHTAAKLKSAQRLQMVATQAPLALSDGLSTSAITALAVIMGEADTPTSSITTYTYKQQMETAGVTSVWAKIAMMELEADELAETFKYEDYEGDFTTAIRLTSKGVNWILQHSHRFEQKATPPARAGGRDTPFDRDDIPF